MNLPPDSLTIEQILIAENSIKINGSTLKANISVKTKNDLLIGKETIILTGFKQAIELKTNWVKLALEKGEESLHNYLKNGIFDIAKIKNSIFKNREQIFANIPNDFNLNSFEIEIDKNSGIFAPITVKISIPEFVISGIELHLFGFFQAIGANLLLNVDEISLYSYLDNKADQQEILEKMKQLIFNHAAEIFINIPDDFALNYIKINRVMSSVYLAGYLGVDFSVSRKSDTDNLFDSEIPYYVPSSGPQLLPLPFIMGGFFDNLKSAKINLSPEEKGKNQYLTGTNEAKSKMADLIFKYRSKLFVNQPENFTKDWIKILDITNDNSATNVLEVSFKLTNGNQDIFPNAVIKIDGF